VLTVGNEEEEEEEEEERKFICWQKPTWRPL